MDATNDGDACQSFHSTIKSSDRDMQKSELKRHVSFCSIRKVQKYNIQKRCHEVAEEEMTSTDSNGSTTQIMSTSIVTAMVSNSSLAEESAYFHDGPQAVSTPMHIPRICSRKSTPATNTRSSVSLCSSPSTITPDLTNVKGHTTLNLFKNIENQSNGKNSVSTKGIDNNSTVFSNCNDVKSATPNVSGIFDHKLSICQSYSSKNIDKPCNDIVSNMQEKNVKQVEYSSSDFLLKRNFNPVKNIPLRQFGTPGSTPRRPADQRRPPRRTTDRIWLVEPTEESELIGNIDIDAVNIADSLDSTFLENIDCNTEVSEKMANPSFAQELKEKSLEFDNACHSPYSKKSNFLIEQRPDLEMSISHDNNNESDNAHDIIMLEKMEQSSRPIDASLIDSWIKAKLNKPHRAVRLSLPQSQMSFLSSVQDLNSANESSSVSFTICNDEEFNMTVDESEKVCAEMKTLREIHERKKVIFNLLEMIMDKKEKLMEVEPQLNIELSQSFQALYAKLNN